jgi:hypothetical protein
MKQYITIIFILYFTIFSLSAQSKSSSNNNYIYQGVIDFKDSELCSKKQVLDSVIINASDINGSPIRQAFPYNCSINFQSQYDTLILHSCKTSKSNDTIYVSISRNEYLGLKVDLNIIVIKNFFYSTLNIWEVPAGNIPYKIKEFDFSLNLSEIYNEKRISGKISIKYKGQRVNQVDFYSGLKEISGTINGCFNVHL